VEALLDAVGRVRGALAMGPDLVVVNKFGKTECEGRGGDPSAPSLSSATRLAAP